MIYLSSELLAGFLRNASNSYLAVWSTTFGLAAGNLGAEAELRIVDDLNSEDVATFGEPPMRVIIDAELR